VNDTRVFLLRHAETAQPTVFHGFESDIDLGPRGERQALAVARVVAGYRPHALVSSNMLRARKTAAAIAMTCDLPVRIDPDFHERKVGSLQGMSVSGTGVWSETLQRWIVGDTDYSPSGMESFAQIRDRVLPVWDRVTQEFSGKSVVIVAHGIVCRVIILSIAEGYNVADWHRLGRIENASITELVGAPREHRQCERTERNEQARRSWHAVRIGDVPNEVREVNADETP
jgi:2,3-bisphosphoglycerate-dependent phosphoglycerate mutase